MASEIGYMTSEQLQKLEELFVECKFPNKNFIKKWSKDLGMDRDQIKCWFKNKRLLIQIEEKSRENEALRRENEIIQRENFVLSKQLESSPQCQPCSGNEIRGSLLRENALLIEEYRRVTDILVGILQGQDSKQDDVDLELRLGPSTRQI